ncbi:hypothetical protein IQ254_15355 [Nodosilinea sp. LEGE 07088]|uniref:hypothetical protein n=1 Tax=Nodosilinea sp. LEGE 07088 TaxID=2777968 RepID=UPI0018816C76|nr:hypothetical protein [Nodosilinea sp. LEGE 07088]MBE9138551.1 hypothetical protein [Nodosilinea sp. LEGE 07088]
MLPTISSDRLDLEDRYPYFANVQPTVSTVLFGLVPRALAMNHDQDCRIAATIRYYG